MLKMLKIVVVHLALINTAFAGTAWFYSKSSCPGNLVVGACTNLPANTCCTDKQVGRANVWSAEIGGIGNSAYTVLAISDNGKCFGVQYLQGSNKCLQTGTNDILGILWQTTVPTHDRRRSTLTTECNAIQHFDIYNIALPGGERKPYSAALAEKFGHADAVDWTTRSFKADKVNVVQDIIAQHGHGLNDAQLAAISGRFNL